MAARVRHASVLLTSVVAALLAIEAVAQDARAWLDRMNRAVEELSYEGTFVHVFGGNAETLRIAHRSVDGRVGERIVSMNGSGREIIRDEESVQCILPDRSAVFLVDERHSAAGPLVTALPDYSEDLDPHYDLKLYKTARVADRSTQVVGIRPRDEFRYGYVLWLDEETAMPLKSQLRSETGDVIEQILFTDFRMSDDIPDSALQSTVDTSGFTWYRPPSLPDEPAGPQVAWQTDALPKGFRLSAAEQRSIAGSKYPVEHLVYTDGLATVSVFIEDPEANPEVEEGFFEFGSTNAYSLTVRGHKITAIGDVPRQTVHRIATSLHTE